MSEEEVKTKIAGSIDRLVSRMSADLRYKLVTNAEDAWRLGYEAGYKQALIDQKKE